MTAPVERVCLRCGFASSGSAPFCRRCGLPFGVAPVVAEGDWPAECPVCYAAIDRHDLLPDGRGGLTTYERHAYDHELRPVGDDAWLETLRDGDEIRIGAWRAPYDLTRRYLVTGQWEGGRAREYAHNAVVLAMVGASRAAAAEAAGSSTAPPSGDLAAARGAVDDLRERYAAGSRR